MRADAGHTGRPPAQAGAERIGNRHSGLEGLNERVVNGVSAHRGGTSREERLEPMEIDKTLRKLGRVELLELLVEQGEELERVQAELEATKARAAHQERIARLAEEAVSRLTGLLEAAQLCQESYSQRLKELRVEMGLQVAKAEAPAEEAPSEEEAPQEEVTLVDE